MNWWFSGLLLLGALNEVSGLLSHGQALSMVSSAGKHYNTTNFIVDTFFIQYYNSKL